MAQIHKCGFPLAQNARKAGVKTVKTDDRDYKVRSVKTGSTGLELFFMRDSLLALGMLSPAPSKRDLRRVPEGAIFLCPANVYPGTGVEGARLITRAGLRCFVAGSNKPNRDALLAWLDRKEYIPAQGSLNYLSPEEEQAAQHLRKVEAEVTQWRALGAARGFSIAEAAQ